MTKSIGNLKITSFCSDNAEHIKFAREVTEDLLIRKYVSHNMDEWLEDSENTDKLYVGPAYIIKHNEQLVGFIRMASLAKDGRLNLHYGVHPEHRKNHYGTKILTEVPNYIFETMPNVEKIQLFIKSINESSIRCAKNTGFYLDDIHMYGNNITEIYSKNR